MVLEFVKYIILLCSKYDIYIHVYTEEQIQGPRHLRASLNFWKIYIVILSTLIMKKIMQLSQLLVYVSKGLI